jgi:Carboxypeptidase regulatory-like domain
MKFYPYRSIGAFVLRTLRIWLLALAAIAIAAPLAAQDVDAPKPEAGHITGTVTDVNDDPVPGATVVLEGSALGDLRAVVSNNNGFFEFNDLEAGPSYHVNISAQGFANWTSPAVILKPGETLILTGSKLQIAQAQTTVSVVYSSEQVATEEVKIEEQQRVFGIIPNFYVVYDHNAEPLTTKLKFRLALKTSTDPVTIFGLGVLAAVHQAGDVPNYRQGWKGYAERYGASTGDGLSDIMIGGAILPSLLHQDPRYFYQGTGTNISRALHALSNAFVCRGDNGRIQPNYSTIGGDLASAALSNVYYPASDRGARLVLQIFVINTAERLFTSLAQEFVMGRLTSKGKHKN